MKKHIITRNQKEMNILPKTVYWEYVVIRFLRMTWQMIYHVVSGWWLVFDSMRYTLQIFLHSVTYPDWWMAYYNPAQYWRTLTCEWCLADTYLIFHNSAVNSMSTSIWPGPVHRAHFRKLITDLRTVMGMLSMTKSFPVEHGRVRCYTENPDNSLTTFQRNRREI